MFLDRIQRIALARVLSDLIEADFIVEEREMDFFEKIISKEDFNISEAMIIEAKRMDFAKAVSILKELDDSNKKSIIATLKQMSLSDGTCVPLEAILIYSVSLALTDDAFLYSVPAEGVNIDNLTIIYVENEDKTAVDFKIQNNLSFLNEKFSDVGFHFIYIPSVVNDFKNLGTDYLHKVVKYMIPSSSEKTIGEICNKLCNLNTSCFCRDLLYKKIGLNLIDAKPSLLIKINESDIIDQLGTDNTERTRFCNFLQIELNKDVIENVTDFISSYKEMINSEININRNSKGYKFLYYGFHRSLFDLVAYGKKMNECRLVFDISTHDAKVYFVSLESRSEKYMLKLNPQETALYIMIAKKSISGEGLDWREHIPIEEKNKLLYEYNRIYGFVGKGNIVNEYKDRTQTHHIKTRIKLLKNIANVDMFIPEHVKNGNLSFYKIRASRDFVSFILPRDENLFSTL